MNNQSGASQIVQDANQATEQLNQFGPLGNEVLQHMQMPQQPDGPPSVAEMIARYLTINARAGGNPMYSTDQQGVQTRNMDISGNVEARIPMDQLIADAILKMRAGGYAYGGNVNLPEKFGGDRINYQGGGITNLGIGFEKGPYGVDVDYRKDPQTNSKTINAGFKVRF